MQTANDQDDLHKSTSPSDIVLEELNQLLTTTPQSFFDMLDQLEADESYFVCVSGAVVRVLRGPVAGLGTSGGYASVVEFYSFEGELIDRRSKGFEPSNIFALHYNDTVVRSHFTRYWRDLPLFL